VPDRADCAEERAMSEVEQYEVMPDSGQRIIKRYANRKLYDTRDSRYVTLLQLAAMIREGEDVRVLDNATKEDKTEVTLALIFSEELKSRPRALPVSTLEALVRQHGRQQAPESDLASFDEPVRTLLPAAVVAHLEQKLDRLAERVAEIEGRLTRTEVRAGAEE
jgi:polyhydroxyalkanoate synthesis repressor PhaR